MTNCMHLYLIYLFQLNYPLLFRTNKFIIRRLFVYMQHTVCVRAAYGMCTFSIHLFLYTTDDAECPATTSDCCTDAYFMYSKLSTFKVLKLTTYITFILNILQVYGILYTRCFGLGVLYDVYSLTWGTFQHHIKISDK
jgi:hypothetical protein